MASSSSTAPSGTGTSRGRSATAGLTLTWALWDNTDDIDPAVPTDSAALEITKNVLDTLVTMDANQKVYPALATRWEVDAEAKKFTFTLRSGVKFHDGSLLDSAAVKRSWERLLDPATKAITAVSLFGPVDRIDAPDASTVVVTFKEPFPLFLTQIRRPYFGVLSARQLDSLKPGDKVTVPIGTGPYKHMGRSADGVVTLEAFADYAWGSELLTNHGMPYLQTMKLRSIADTSTRVATLESGENLLIDELSEADYARLKGDQRFRFVTSPRVGPAVGFFINVQKAPTDDLAVRQAINWAVDRKSIVDKLYFGVHKPAVGVFTEGVWGRLDRLESTYGYDPAKARQLLDAAGWSVGANGPIRQKAGQPLALALATFRSSWTDIAEAMQAQMRDVGIDLQVQKLARGPYLDFIRQYQHNLCATSGSDLDPDVLRQRYISTGLGMDNFANLADPQLDALLVKGAQQTIGSDERRQTYEAVQTRLMDTLPFVSVMGQMRVEAMSARVHDLKMEPDGVNALATTDVWVDA